METGDTTKSYADKFIYGKVAGNCTGEPISPPPSEIRAADPFKSNAKDVEKLQATLAPKGTAITETALRVLLQKREEMCHQQHVLEDKIALCSRDIQKIKDGNEDSLALKLQVIMDGRNDACLRGKATIQGETHQEREDHRTIQCSRRNRPTGIILSLQSPCQISTLPGLDDICHVNNWRLPRYSVSASTGRFVADVTIKEMDCDISCQGALLSTPKEARESAATLMIAKLRKMTVPT